MWPVRIAVLQGGRILFPSMASFSLRFGCLPIKQNPAKAGFLVELAATVVIHHLPALAIFANLTVYHVQAGS